MKKHFSAFIGASVLACKPVHSGQGPCDLITRHTVLYINTALGVAPIAFSTENYDYKKEEACFDVAPNTKLDFVVSPSHLCLSMKPDAEKETKTVFITTTQKDDFKFKLWFTTDSIRLLYDENLKACRGTAVRLNARQALTYG